MDNEGYMGYPGDITPPTSYPYPPPNVQNSSGTPELAGILRSLEHTLQLQTQTFIKIENNLRRYQIHANGADEENNEPGQNKITKDYKVPVYVRVVFLKIGEIDTLKEKYSADVYIQARWREPALDGKTHLNSDTIDWKSMWNPQLHIENLHGEIKSLKWFSLTFDEQGRASVYEKHRVNGTFLEFLELQQFPFDTQDLTVTVSTERSELEVSLEEDHIEVSGINVQSFVDEQEWALHHHVEIWKKFTTKVFQKSKYKHPGISVACKATRRPGFFIWNIFFVMLFICSLAFSTFTVDLDLPQNRLQLSFILLLTTITFKFTVNQNLPMISYLTYLDKYILTSMFILCLVCVWHAIVPRLEAPYTLAVAKTADKTALIILGSAYLAFHVFFFLFIYFSTRPHPSAGRSVLTGINETQEVVYPASN